MPAVPIAAFLAGALLSLLLPTLLLTALVVWYTRFVKRAPGPADGSEPANPGPDAVKRDSPDAGATSKEA